MSQKEVKKIKKIIKQEIKNKFCSKNVFLPGVHLFVIDNPQNNCYFWSFTTNLYKPCYVHVKVKEIYFSKKFNLV